MVLPDTQDILDQIEGGSPTEAIPVLRELAERMPAYAALRVLLARAYEAVDALQEARAIWQHAYFLMPNSPAVREGLARTLDASPSASPAPEFPLTDLELDDLDLDDLDASPPIDDLTEFTDLADFDEVETDVVVEMDDLTDLADFDEVETDVVVETDDLTDLDDELLYDFDRPADFFPAFDEADREADVLVSEEKGPPEAPSAGEDDLDFEEALDAYLETLTIEDPRDLDDADGDEDEPAQEPAPVADSPEGTDTDAPDAEAADDEDEPGSDDRLAQASSALAAARADEDPPATAPAEEAPLDDDIWRDLTEAFEDLMADEDEPETLPHRDGPDVEPSPEGPSIYDQIEQLIEQGGPQEPDAASVEERADASPSLDAPADLELDDWEEFDTLHAASSADAPAGLDIVWPAEADDPEDAEPPVLDSLDDLERLIDELEAAHLVPAPNLDDLPTPDLDDNIDDMVSETLARIYASQRQFQEAARVYDELARQQPARADRLRTLAAEMRAQAAAAEDTGTRAPDEDD